MRPQPFRKCQGSLFANQKHMWYETETRLLWGFLIFFWVFIRTICETKLVCQCRTVCTWCPPSPEWYELFDQKRAAASIWPITVSSTACLMLGAREMKGENGFSALTVRLFLLVFLQIATLYILDLQLILLPLHPARLKAFSLKLQHPVSCTRTSPNLKLVLKSLVFWLVYSQIWAVSFFVFLDTKCSFSQLFLFLNFLLVLVGILL